MAISLLDSVLSYQLTSRGLPEQAIAPVGTSTQPPADSNYGASSDKVTTLSGYGQLLSAASTFDDNLAAASISGRAVQSTNASVATGSAASDSSLGSLSLSVGQVAKSRSLQSAYFTDPAADIFNPGRLSIQVGSNTAVNVNISSGSLNGIASAINSANAGVTASVSQDSNYGYKLVLSGNTTGTSSSFTVSATQSDDPLNGGKINLNLLGLTQTQAAQNASYSVNGQAATSESNTVTVASGVTATLQGAGNADLTVSQSYSDLLATAQKLVGSYNALQGNISLLTGSNGALAGNANATSTANGLSTALYNKAQDSFTISGSSLTQLSQIGISFGGGSTASSPLQLDTTALQNAFNSDSTGTVSLLSTALQGLRDVTGGYTQSGGTILTQAGVVKDEIKQGINTTLAQGSSPVPTWVSDVLLQRAIDSSGSIVLPGFSTYA
ncbi:flagellar filament capping protein FliD [Chitinimonas lacunae]|uniref:Flagellar filament capping protein FliD n=1 Tax=Chitinimonas lacunae TaxID=1963018 RepID=A0ABV8MLT0_9NEIS